MKARTFNIMQYEENPATGESLNFTEKNIIDGLNHRGIKKYAYIAHDKDVYTAKDVERMKEQYDLDVAEGDTKPKHWHVVLSCPNKAEVYSIAKWFGIPEFCVDVPKGYGAFLDCVYYLTHEDEKQQEMGKVVYPSDEVKADFDWKAELEKRAERQLRYGKDLSDKDYYRSEVFAGRLTLRDMAVKYPLAYQNDYAALDKLRLKYISSAEPPKNRINYYIDGVGGIGKSLMSRALARSLYQSMYNCGKLPDDDDMYFCVGAKGVAFEGYDGQPIIIWDDRRAADLITELNGRGNVFDVFETHPKKGKQNVKYGSVNLINRVNIINGIEPYKDFINGLAGEYTDRNNVKHAAEDRNQSRRRIPFIINVHEDDFNMLINKGFYDVTNNFSEYYEYTNIRGSVRKIHEKLSACCDEVLIRDMETGVVRPIVDKHMELEGILNKGDISDEERAAIIAELENDSGQDIEAVKKRMAELADKLHELYGKWDSLNLVLHNMVIMYQDCEENDIVLSADDKEEYSRMYGEFSRAIDSIAAEMDKVRAELDNVRLL